MALAAWFAPVVTHGLFGYSSASQQSVRDNIHTPESARVFPAHLTASGWVSLGEQQYMPLSACEGKLFNLPKARCVAECTNAANASSECRACDPLCGALIHRWRSPTGQTLESLTTLTDPPFVFAYNPYDDDMLKMRRTLILEPTLTRVWHETTGKCCSSRNGLTVDVSRYLSNYSKRRARVRSDARVASPCQVGGNYGWYTLYSLALGCSVVVFEPVPRYLEVMQLGLSLNPGFASRVTIFSNVVYDEPGEYSLRVPNVNRHLVRPLSIGMTGMDGRAGVLKTIWSAKATIAKAKAVRLDDIVQRDICLLKADVEGYEPQVFQTAAALLSRYSVAAVQFELTHTSNADQTCASINMIEQLLGPLDFELRQIMPASLHSPLPDVSGRPYPRPWKTAPSAWDTLVPFPSKPPCASATRPCNWQSGSWAYLVDFKGYSTNLFGLRRDSFRPGVTVKPWPPLQCSNVTGKRPEKEDSGDLTQKRPQGGAWQGATHSAKGGRGKAKGGRGKRHGRGAT